MKYESEIINKIIEKRGHEKSSIHYESECIEEWIKEAEGAYPKLCDYESEWLNYIVESPIGEFPYVTLSDVTEATVNNVVPYEYKSAILKGSTKYRDIDTGEILESFEEGRKLELVSVKMPVLTTTGKNLLNEKTMTIGYISSTGEEKYDRANAKYEYTRISPNTTYYGYNFGYAKQIQISWYDSNKTFLNRVSCQNGASVISPSNAYYARVHGQFFEHNQDGNDFSMVKMMFSTEPVSSYEPYKSNILTVNEDIELRGIGDVQDTLDCLTGEVINNVGKFIFDGTHDYGVGTTGDVTRISISNVNARPKTQPICDKLKSILYRVNSQLGDELACIHHTNDRIDIYISTSKCGATIDEIKAYLTTNPITVQYQLETDSIKTVDLIVTNQDGQSLLKIRPIEGTMHLSTDGETIKPTFTGEIPIEAITQNLASFIEE